MRTIAEIQVQAQGTLWVDIQLDPPGLAIRREAGGLVHVELAELPKLIITLMLAGGELAELKAEAEENGLD